MSSSIASFRTCRLVGSSFIGIFFRTFENRPQHEAKPSPRPAGVCVGRVNIGKAPEFILKLQDKLMIYSVDTLSELRLGSFIFDQCHSVTGATMGHV